MKRFIAIILASVYILGLAGCQSNETDDTLEEISRMLGIDANSGEIVTGTDTHGGFHGDGTAFFEIKLSDTDATKEIEENWKEMPLTDNLTALVYGLETEAGSVGPMLHGGNNSPFIPEVANGYYWFADRHSQSTDLQDDSEVLSRYSFNFTLAVYDTDTQTLYYMELDT